MENNYQIYGIRAIMEAIQSGKSIDKVFIQKGLKGGLFHELELLIQKHQINVSFVPVEKLNRLTRKNHQGVIATISPIEFHNFEEMVIKILESGKNPIFYYLTNYRCSQFWSYYSHSGMHWSIGDNHTKKRCGSWLRRTP